MKLVIIPTYNERENLKELLPLIYSAVVDIHILIIDDNSPDGTGELVDTLIAEQFSGCLYRYSLSPSLPHFLQRPLTRRLFPHRLQRIII